MSTRKTQGLETQLREATATIRALLNGEIDAVVDPESQTPVFLRRAQDALRASEERYRRIVETANEGVWLLDAENNTTFMNQRMAQMLGCRLPSCVGRPLSDFVDEAERSMVEAHLRQGDTHQLEVRYRRIDGTTIWAMLAATPFFDGEGNYDGSLSMVMDITARRDMEITLRETASELTERSKLLQQQAALLDLSRDAIVVRNLDEQIVFWNRGAEAMYGWSSEEALGKCTDELLATKYSQPKESIKAWLFHKGRWEGEETHRRRDGSYLNVASQWNVQFGEGGEPERILTKYEDITDRKKAEAELRLLTERLGLATSVAQIGVWEWDLNAHTLTWDATMFAMYGMKPAARMPYKNWASAVHPEDLPGVERILRRVVAEKGEGSAEFRIILPDSTVRNISAAERVVLDEHGQVSRVIGVNVDITERRAMALQLAYSAEHDFLTGLPNRMLLNDRISQAISAAKRHGKKAAVLFLDLDGFKHINDSLGHGIGDKLLQSVSRRLVDCVRSADTVSRQGGDEFVVLLAEVKLPEDPAITARRILQAVAEKHAISQHDLHVTTSIGLAVYPDDGVDADTLIKNADTAMYQAKENGRQSYQFFKLAMNVRAVARQSIEESLRRALDRHEFVLHYQPQIRLLTGEISGAEALIRWTTAEGKQISPSEFIPVAEDCGLILQIGKWVLREACTQAQAWINAGLPRHTICANISALQFRDEHFLEFLFSTLHETGLSADLLELELTESALMKHADAAHSILRAARARGIHVAIDDFGTGYSSLSYLTKFPVDTLKIDQSFIRRISKAPNETSIVEAVLGMAKSLKLRVVAEGVESQEEVDFLQARACDEAQGFYFSKAVAPEQFAKLLANGGTARC